MRINTISKVIVTNIVHLHFPNGSTMEVAIYGRLSTTTQRLVVRRYLLDDYVVDDEKRAALEANNFTIEKVDTSEQLYECSVPQFLGVAHKVNKRTR